MFCARVSAKYTVTSSFMSALNDHFANIMRDPKFQKHVIKDAKAYSKGMSKDDVLSRAFEELYVPWMTDLERRGTFENGKLVIYRGVTVAKIEDIDLGKVGTFWTWDEKKAANYSDRGHGNPLHVLVTSVDLSSIKLYETLLLLTWAGYDHEDSEREIRLNDGAPLEIQEIRLKGTQVLEKPIKAKA